MPLDQFGFPGLRSSPASSTYSIVRAVRGPSVRVTRANNATAYAAGQVYGDAADARYSFVVPALPQESSASSFGALTIVNIQGTPPTSGLCQLQLVPFSAQPATVQGDGSQLALSDADIASILPGSVPSAGSGLWSFPATTVGAQSVLNQTASIAGRRGLASSQTLPLGFAVSGSVMWFYLQMLTAYTPTALETMDLIPYWIYTSRIAV